MQSAIRSRFVSGLVLAALGPLALASLASADTGTSLGDRLGEGSTQFTGLAKAVEANLFTGALTTTIPIEIPAGRKNMTPQLTLQYSSAAGAGPFGYGWDLPIGQIERSTKWGVPRCDGSHTDDFVLTLPSGAVELVQDAPGSATFRPRVEQAYVKAQRFTTENYWVVFDRAGLKYTFGKYESARVGNSTPPVFMQNNPCRFTSVWALSTVEDANGNVVAVGWDKITNVLYPTYIFYGGNQNSPPVNILYNVHFVTEDRPPYDQIRSFHRGVDALLSKRIKAIEVSSQVNGQTGLIKTYTLQFKDNPASASPDGYRSLLSHVSVPGQPALDFVYTPSTTGHQVSTTSIAKPSGAWGELRVVNTSLEVSQTVLDMDGDGVLDLVRSDDPPAGAWSVWFGSIDANGTPSLSSTATSWEAPGNWSTIRNVAESTSDCDSNGWKCTQTDTFDITGDGIPDHVVAMTAGNWTVYKGRSSPQWGFGPGVAWPAPSDKRFIRRTYTSGQEAFTFQDVLDINADGLPDLVHSSPTQAAPFQWDIYLNTGSGFELTRLADFPAPVKSLTYQFAGSDKETLIDFNGDGLPDLLRAGPVFDPRCEPSSTKFNSCLEVYFNTGQGFSPTAILQPVPPYDYVQGATSAGDDRTVVQDMFDVNGDGLPDWVYHYWNDGGQSWRVLLNLGGTLEPLTYVEDGYPDWGKMEGIPGRVWTGVQGDFRVTLDGNARTDLLDVNGDGLLDYVTAGSTWSVHLHNAATRPNLLATVANGMGGSTSVFYTPSTRYDNTGADDQTDLPFPTWVVSGIRQTDGRCGSIPVNPLQGDNACLASGNDLVAIFDYQDGRFDPVSREFRGFGRVVRRTVEGMAGGQPVGNDTVTYFGQGDATKGRVVQVATYVGNADLDHKVRSEVNDWRTAALANGRTQIWLWRNARRTWDYPAASATHFVKTENDEVDAYGNVTHFHTVGDIDAERVDTYTWYAPPVSGTSFPVYERPSRVMVQDQSGVLEEKWFYYDADADHPDGLAAEVAKGNVARVVARLSPTNANGPVVRSKYDTYGNVIEVKDPNGHLTATTYDPVYLYPYSVTNQKGHTTLAEMNYFWGQPRKTYDVNNQVTEYTYDNAGRRSCIARPGEQITDCPIKYEYFLTPASGQLASIKISELQDAPAPALWLQQYFDGLGRPRYRDMYRVVDGIDRTVRVGDTTYDGGGRPRMIFNPYLAGSAVDATDVTTFDYHLNGSSYTDPFGRPLTVVHSDGTQRVQLFAGAETTTIDELGSTRKVTIDAFGRLKKDVLYNGQVPYTTVEHTYDGLGREVLLTTNDVWLKVMYYDSLGRKTQMVDADSGVWKYGYDSVGNLVWQDDPKPNQHIRICYDEINRPVERCPIATDYVATSCATSCDDLDRVSYAYDEILTTGSNARGRLTTAADASGTTEFEFYDERGRPKNVRRTISVNGVRHATFEYTYDRNDRPRTVKYPDGEVVETVYGNDGQPIALKNATEMYITDAEYDLYGRAKFIQHVNGVKDTHAFGDSSARHRLTGLSVVDQDSVGGPTTHLNVSFSYNNRGQIGNIVDLRNPSGVLSDAGQFTYDSLARLTLFDSPEATSDRTYGYDAMGNITRHGKAGGADWFFDYDDPAKPHQATEVHVGSPSAPAPFSVQHDENGNRKLKSSDSYEYDKDDRVSEVIAGGHTVDFVYDYGGQKAVEIRDADTPTPYYIRYYSALAATNTGNVLLKSYYFGGQRVATRMTTNVGWEVAALGDGLMRFAAAPMSEPALVLRFDRALQLPAAAGVATIALVLLAAPWRARRSAGVALRHGHVVGGALVWFLATLPWPLVLLPELAEAGGSGGTTVRHYHLDQLGNTQVITKEDGSISEQIRYTPYGETRGRWDASNTALSNVSTVPRFDFGGYETEAYSGLAYAGARFYDPSMGSFLTQDPAAQLSNPYTYTGWDPVNRVDPTGAAWWVIPLIVAVIASAVASIQSYINTGNFLESFKAGTLAGAIGFVSGGLLGAVGSAAYSAGGSAWGAYLAVTLSVAAYGTAESFRSGQYFAGAIGAVLLAYGAYESFRGIGAKPTQGANGVQKQLPSAKDRYFFETAVTDPAAQPTRGDMVLDLVAAPEHYFSAVAADSRFGSSEFQRAVNEFFGDGGKVAVTMDHPLPSNAYGYQVDRLGPHWPPKIAIGPPSFESFGEFADTVIHEFSHQIGYSDPYYKVYPFKGYASDFARRELSLIVNNKPPL